MSCSLQDLPGRVWPGLFLHLLAAGSNGLATTAVFEQTCKAVRDRAFYTNLQLEEEMSDPAHPCWTWLEHRRDRISGLSLHVKLRSWQGLSQAWQHPLSLLAQVQGLRLKLATPDTPSGAVALASAFLQQQGNLISKLSLEFEPDGPDYAEALLGLVAQQCADVEVYLRPEGDYEIDLAGLQPLAGKLTCISFEGGGSTVVGVSTLTALTRLTHLSLESGEPMAEPWAALAAQTGLQHLTCSINTTGDAAPLSMLTGLTSLHLDPCGTRSIYMSNLQSITALRQLQKLTLVDFSTTSLHDLGGLSSLRQVRLWGSTSFVSLEGLNPTGLTSLSLGALPQVSSLAGLSWLQCLQELRVEGGVGITSLEPLSQLASLRALDISNLELPSLAGVGNNITGLTLHSVISLTSLQPLAGLRHLRELHVSHCRDVVESILLLPHFDRAGSIMMHHCMVEKVVLAGGVHMEV